MTTNPGAEISIAFDKPNDSRLPVEPRIVLDIEGVGYITVELTADQLVHLLSGTVIQTKVKVHCRDH